MSNSHTFSGKSNNSQPVVVGTIYDKRSLDVARKLIPGAVDLLEWRADHFSQREKLPALPPIPIILTVRRGDEGGHGDLGLPERIALFQALMPSAVAVDIEWRSWKALASIREEAVRGKMPVIASWHDFQKTPPLSSLQKVVENAMEAGADLVKIASTLVKPADLDRLTALLLANRNTPLAVMGMGPLGKASRLILAGLGSRLNYGFLGRAQVPGQWPAPLFKERLIEAGIRSHA